MKSLVIYIFFLFLIFNNSDSHAQWVQTNGLNNRIVHKLAISGDNIFSVTDSGAYRSTNNGTDWTQLGLNKLVYAIAVSGNKVFAIDVYSMFFSTDNGTTWTQVNNGLTHTLVRSFAVNDSYIFAGTDNGVWRRPLSELVPVELSSFTANTNSDIVNLNWNTATETNNRGFEIQRKSSTYDFATVGFVNGNGTSTEINNYSWSEKLEPGIYSYRLKQVDYNGKYEYSKTVEVVVNPNTFSLEQNYPNPFNPTTTIRYNVPFECNIKLNVFNSLGENVREFNIGTKSAGLYDLNFNSNRLTSGVYFYSITATSLNGKQNFRCTKKMILMK